MDPARQSAKACPTGVQQPPTQAFNRTLIGPIKPASGPQTEQADPCALLHAVSRPLDRRSTGPSVDPPSSSVDLKRSRLTLTLEPCCMCSTGPQTGQQAFNRTLSRPIKPVSDPQREQADPEPVPCCMRSAGALDRLSSGPSVDSPSPSVDLKRSSQIPASDFSRSSFPELSSTSQDGLVVPDETLLKIPSIRE
eukprot:gene31706-6911_t